MKKNEMVTECLFSGLLRDGMVETLHVLPLYTFTKVEFFLSHTTYIMRSIVAFGTPLHGIPNGAATMGWKWQPLDRHIP